MLSKMWDLSGARGGVREGRVLHGDAMVPMDDACDRVVDLSGRAYTVLGVPLKIMIWLDFLPTWSAISGVVRR
jgi:imidazoleglycerol phosphate dehydratase HisB